MATEGIIRVVCSGLVHKQPLGGKIRITGEVFSEFSQSGFISRCRHECHVYCSTSRFLQLLDRCLSIRIHRRADTECYKSLTKVQTQHLSAKHIFLEQVVCLARYTSWSNPGEGTRVTLLGRS